jgi:hypothetical protein
MIAIHSFSLEERYIVDVGLGLGLGLLCNLDLLTTVHDGEYRYSTSNKEGKKGSEFQCVFMNGSKDDKLSYLV